MIICVGSGPGNLDFITCKGKRLIEEAEVVTGFQAVLDIVAPCIRPDSTQFPLTYANQVEELEKVATLHREGKRCVAVFMGDIHFSGFQFLARVETACGHEVETVPGISSSQILASKTRVCFDETTFLTFHRRGDIEPFKKHLVSVLGDGRNAIVIPLPWTFMPKDIAAYLLDQGVSPEHRVEVWENLTRAEAEWRGTLAGLKLDFSDMSIMLIRALAD